MRICIRLAGGLRELTGLEDNNIVLEDPAMRKVRDIMHHLPLERGDVGLVLCEGRLLDPDDELSDGMVIILYPVVGGG